MNYELPKPDTHCFDTDTGLDVWSYSKEQMLSLRNQTLEDAAQAADQVAADARSTQRNPYLATNAAMVIRNLKGTS